ncbi:hypothetical protein ACJX0J_014301 [Zea mays]
MYNKLQQIPRVQLNWNLRMEVLQVKLLKYGTSQYTFSNDMYRGLNISKQIPRVQLNWNLRMEHTFLKITFSFLMLWCTIVALLEKEQPDNMEHMFSDWLHGLDVIIEATGILQQQIYMKAEICSMEAIAALSFFSFLQKTEDMHKTKKKNHFVVDHMHLFQSW